MNSDIFSRFISLTSVRHRAGDWGDLAKPLWKGRLRFIEKGSSGAALLFEDGTTGMLQLFVPRSQGILIAGT
jgi:hypothetical protein